MVPGRTGVCFRARARARVRGRRGAKTMLVAQESTLRRLHERILLRTIVSLALCGLAASMLVASPAPSNEALLSMVLDEMQVKSMPSILKQEPCPAPSMPHIACYGCYASYRWGVAQQHIQHTLRMPRSALPLLIQLASIQ